MGQRRVGKSYLMRQIMRVLAERRVVPTHIVYINKESGDFDDVRTSKDLLSLIQAYRQTCRITKRLYVFVDEVQDIDGWEKAVVSLAQDPQQLYEVFLTGSNSTMLSSELATKLTGRYISFDVFSFSYKEFCQSRSLVVGKESYLVYLRIGGLPELLHLPNEETSRKYLASLRYSILLKDIVSHFVVKDVPLLEDIFSFCVDSIGSLVSVQNIVMTLKKQHRKTNHETVSLYLDYLCQAFLLHEAMRYDVRGHAVLERQRKYYLNDLAFRTFHRSSFDPAPGRLLENAVFLHYRSCGYQVYVGVVGKKEVDFVVEKNGQRMYIQCAYILSDESVVSREFGVLEEINTHGQKYVITLDDVSFGMRNGIEHIRPWELKIE